LYLNSTPWNLCHWTKYSYLGQLTHIYTATLQPYHLRITSQKMELLLYLDTILVPLSLFLTLGYHGLLWHICKNKPHLRSIWINRIRKRLWVLSITERPDEIVCLTRIINLLLQDTNDKKLMLSLQSLRNTLMITILTATIAITLNICLAAFTNNTYKASHLLQDSYFGLQSSRILALKYASTSIFLLIGFLCSSMALGCLNDAHILAAVSRLPPGYVQGMMERGFLFSFIGHRMFYITLPLLLWLFGPIPMLLSSMAIVWVLYGIDLADGGFKSELPQSSTRCCIH
ncbi:hypothetical protein IFM89_033529, partial [Coptis chinensis]